MSVLLVVLLIGLNLFISFWNANVVGRFWSERRNLPTSYRVLQWCGVIMAVCGFFYCYVTILTAIMAGLNLFPILGQALFKVEISSDDVATLVEFITSLSYLIVIVPVLGTGMIIMVNSWIVAYRRRDLASIGIGIYNTGAQIHNLVNAVRYVPQATRSLGKGFKLKFKSKDGKGLAMLILMLLPIVISLGAAIATTVMVMKASDAKYELDDVATEQLSSK